MCLPAGLAGWALLYYYESGSVKTEGTYTNGTEDGLRITSYESGGVFKEEPVPAGMVQGMVKEYYESGRLKAETEFLNNTGGRQAHRIL